MSLLVITLGSEPVPALLKEPASNREWLFPNEPTLNMATARTYCAERGKGWRLPTRLELRSVQRLEAMRAKHALISDGYFLSSTTNATGRVLALNLGTGDVAWTAPDAPGRFLCIKGDSHPNEEVEVFSPVGEPYATFSEAERLCFRLESTLPTLLQLETVYDLGSPSSVNTRERAAWTSDKSIQGAWSVDLKYGSARIAPFEKELSVLCIGINDKANTVSAAPKMEELIQFSSKEQEDGSHVLTITAIKSDIQDAMPFSKISVGDTIVRLDGKPITDPTSLPGFWKRRGSSLTIIRNGDTIVIRNDWH